MEITEENNNVHYERDLVSLCTVTRSSHTEEMFKLLPLQAMPLMQAFVKFTQVPVQALMHEFFTVMEKEHVGDNFHWKISCALYFVHSSLPLSFNIEIIRAVCRLLDSQRAFYDEGIFTRHALVPENVILAMERVYGYLGWKHHFRQYLQHKAVNHFDFKFRYDDIPVLNPPEIMEDQDLINEWFYKEYSAFCKVKQAFYIHNICTEKFYHIWVGDEKIVMDDLLKKLFKNLHEMVIMPLEFQYDLISRVTYSYDNVAHLAKPDNVITPNPFSVGSVFP